MIGVAGGSGSGKTTFARMMSEKLGRDQVLILAQDNYYLDQSDRFDRDGGSVNFDHPQAIDWALVSQHLVLIKRGFSIDMPIYDFSTHTRRKEILRLDPRPIVIFDGILIYVPEDVRAHIDHKIFIDASEEIRFERRLKRDVHERGRTEEGVRAQYFSQVKPMHDQFVEPTRLFADRIVSGEEDFTTAIETVVKDLNLK